MGLHSPNSATEGHYQVSSNASMRSPEASISQQTKPNQTYRLGSIEDSTTDGKKYLQQVNQAEEKRTLLFKFKDSSQDIVDVAHITLDELKHLSWVELFSCITRSTSALLSLVCTTQSPRWIMPTISSSSTTCPTSKLTLWTWDALRRPLRTTPWWRRYLCWILRTFWL